MKKLFLITLLALPLLAASYRPAPALAQPASTPTPPAVLLVNSTADPGDGVCDDAECTLREAISEATDGATIEFNLPDDSVIVLIDDQLVINKFLTIDGATSPGLVISGNNSSRIFYVGEEGDVEINALTIRDGNVSSAWEDGGGIYVDEGRLVLTNSTLFDNIASQKGGGIANLMGVLHLFNSVIYNNRAEIGGGIYNEGGTALVVNSTISGNHADYDSGVIIFNSGGGLYNAGTYCYITGDPPCIDGTVYLFNATISNNFALNEGGGVYDRSAGSSWISPWNGWGAGRTYATNTIIGGNQATSGDDCSGDAPPPKHSSDPYIPYGPEGFNLLGEGCDTRSTDLTHPAHLVLKPLADNGGRTLTHALTSSSPAIDAGDPNGCTYDHDDDPDTPNLPLTTDQHGQPRSFDSNGDGIARCDIGAYEAQFTTGIWRFRGYTYQGQPRDTSTPLPGVTLHLYGRNEGEPEPGGWVKTTTSDGSGFFNFYIIQPWVFDTFTLVADAPAGMVGAGIWSEDGQVLEPDSVLWQYPSMSVHENEFYFDMPTPTPIASPTPTVTPSPTATPSPTSTPTTTFTPTPD